MHRILDIDVERRLVRVEPGVVLDQLNTALAPRGLQFGPDVATSSRANLGGMIGNNSAGSRSVRQGKVIDHVRARRRAPVPAGEVPEMSASAPPGLDGRDDGLWSLVRELPDKQRTALALRYVADAGYDEISAVMGTSQDAARRNVHEALKRLRTEYQP